MDSLAVWKDKRRQALEAEDGWLNLTDRVELAQGAQSVGKGAQNDVQLTAGPEHLGVLTLAGTEASFQVPGGPAMPFQPAPGGFPQLRVPPLLLEIHTVDGVPALRVRDLTRPRKAHLSYFPEAPEWVIRARWLRLETPIETTFGQRGGQDQTAALHQVARFTVQGHEITLLPTHWKDGKPMFVLRDGTSGRSTYGASRFLIGENASDDEITLDFNRAFTPPCGFTDFAICPLPPRQNVLPFDVTAGEKKPADS